jgi:hypothetical protein
VSPGTRNLAVVAIVLVALLAAIYAPALGHGFVKDDFRWIAAADVQSPGDVARIFSTNVGFYRPLVTTSFAIDRAMWHLDARGYALTNATLLLANAGLLFLVGRRLSLPPEAALFAAAVWAFNLHGINMALLWTSGRTALLLCLFAQAGALALLAEARWSGVLAGLFTLAAMFCKEEAVMLPPLFVALHVWTGREERTLRGALVRTWPVWVAAVVYGIARAQSGAFSVSNAPDYYRLTFDPRAVLKNAGEYLDRGATFAAIISVILWLSAPRTAPLGDNERGAIRFGTAWFIAMFAITIFVPVRSSLYAVAPSIGTGLIAGACAARASRAVPGRFGRVAAVMIAAIALLLPVYRSRNRGLVEPADLAARSLATIQAAARSQPDARDIVLIDDPQAPVTLDSAFGALFPDAVHLFVSPAVRGTITDEAATAGRADAALVFTLRDGRLVQGRAPRGGPSARINPKPADSSASHSG